MNAASDESAEVPLHVADAATYLVSIADVERMHKSSKTVIGGCRNMTWDVFASTMVNSAVKADVASAFAAISALTDAPSLGSALVDQGPTITKVTKAWRAVELFRFDLLETGTPQVWFRPGSMAIIRDKFGALPQFASVGSICYLLMSIAIVVFKLAWY